MVSSRMAMQLPHVRYTVTCYDKDGNIKWQEKKRNTVVDQGIDDLIDKYLNGSSYTASWFILLKGAGTIANTDTLASHGGWSELTPYSGTRPAITWGAAGGGTAIADAVDIAINATAAVAGMGMCNVASGTSGVLYGAVNFPVVRNVADGDTLSITTEFVIADAP